MMLTITTESKSFFGSPCPVVHRIDSLNQLTGVHFNQVKYLFVYDNDIKEQIRSWGYPHHGLYEEVYVGEQATQILWNLLSMMSEQSRHNKSMASEAKQCGKH